MLLYIHIPFCDSKCSYCAFNTYVDKFHLKIKYMEALQIQLKNEIKIFKLKKKSIESVFIGGGTPSTIEPKLYEPLFKILKNYFQDNIEITSEANPNSANKEWLKGMFDIGVNRISFGVQSFNNKKLEILNRAHNSTQAKDAIKNASKIGFKNISLDLIYATLGDTKEILSYDVNTAFSLPINHISAYALTIEEKTIFQKTPHMANENEKLTSWLFDEIKDRGFKQYEISNFGKYESFHNKGYWQYKDYIGLGSGAVGKLKNTRFYPELIVEKYIKTPCSKKIEILSEDEQREEKIFLGLRSCIGINKNILNKKELKKAQILIDEKKLFIKNDTFYNHDYLLSDEIALFLMT